jgi:hypothetical protein
MNNGRMTFGWREVEELDDLLDCWAAVVALYLAPETEPVDGELLERYLWWEGLQDMGDSLRLNPLAA